MSRNWTEMKLHDMKARAVKATAAGIGILALLWPLGMVAQEQPAASTDLSMAPITSAVPPPPVSISSSLLGIASPLGAQAAAGKPIYAEFITEHQQHFPDGNRISTRSRSTVYRDSKGRIRREAQLSVAGLPDGAAGPAMLITIVDQLSGFGFILNPQEMVAHRYLLDAKRASYVARLSAQANGMVVVPDPKPQGGGTSRWLPRALVSNHNRANVNTPAESAMAPKVNGAPAPGDQSGFAGASAMHMDQPFLAAPNPVRTENLGEQMMMGFRTFGTRVITTLPAGQIGNDRPIDIVSEQWFSPSWKW